MKKYLLLYVIIFLAICTKETLSTEKADSLVYENGKVSKTFTVTSGGNLKIEFEIGSKLKIEGWDKNEVYVEVTGREKEISRIDFDFKQENGKVFLGAEYKMKKNKNSKDVVTNIKVPNKFNIDFQTKGGAVVLNNISGELTGKTMGGELDFEKLSGQIDCTTMGGNVEVNNSELDGNIKTMGGNINLDYVEGCLNVETMGGNINQANVNLKKKDGQDGVTVKTMGGNINLDKILSDGKISTMGGNINVDYVKGTADVSTMGGSIYVKKIDGGIKASTMGGEISVTSEKVGDNINLSSMAGNVELDIPADADVNIKIKVSGFFPEDDDYDNYITSDFKLDYEVKGDELRAKGTNGSGKYTIELTSGNGQVVLRKK